MPIIKARTNRVRMVRHICRLQETNRDTLVLYARFIGDTADYVVNQLIDSTIAKDREFGRLKFEYGGLRARWGGYAGYDAWFGRALNNAHLAAVATYEDCVPGLTRELEGAGSLHEFYGRAAQLAQLSRTERHALVCTAP